MTAGSEYEKSPVDYLSRITALFSGYKLRAADFLDLQGGEKVLDVGCGAGDDLILLHRRYAEKAPLTLFGVDREEETLKQAKAKAIAAGVSVQFEQAEVNALPFPDGSMDVVRSDRVFQHLSEPGLAVREMRRVTRSGGWVQGVDVDWGSLIIDHPQPQTTDQLCGYACNRHVNGRSGRQIGRWFREQGLTDIEGDADAVWVRDLEVADFIWGLTGIGEAMVQQGLMNRAVLDEWWREARALQDQGKFSASMTGFVVRGRVP